MVKMVFYRRAWVLLGAHSDFGGGYPENFHEHVQVTQPRKFLGPVSYTHLTLPTICSV